MAKENMNEELGETKETPMKTSGDTPEASETNETSDVASENDIEQILMLLNEIDKSQGGKGSIAGLSPETVGPVRYLAERLKSIVDLYEDPLFKDVLDDMHEQRMDGQVPSLLVAVARNVPMEELTRLADDEDYEGVQTAVNDRLSKVKEDEDSEKALYGNFDTSKKNIDAYCSEMGYDDGRKQKLYATISMLRNCFADGLLTKEEIAKIDKIDNYDGDVQTLKSQATPAGGVKTVLPDKASIEESMTQRKTPSASQNSIENTASYQKPAYLEVGKRKIEKSSKRV